MRSYGSRSGTLWRAARAARAILIASPLSGCSLFGGGQVVTVPVTDLRGIDPIQWGCAGDDAAYGKARKGIIKLNSILATSRAGRKVVYADDCPKPKAPTS